MAEGTIDSLQIEITANSDKAAESVKNLCNALRQLKTVTKGGSSNFSKSIDAAGKSAGGAIDKLMALSKVLSRLQSQMNGKWNNPFAGLKIPSSAAQKKAAEQGTAGPKTPGSKEVPSETDLEKKVSSLGRMRDLANEVGRSLTIGAKGLAQYSFNGIKAGLRGVAGAAKLAGGGMKKIVDMAGGVIPPVFKKAVNAFSTWKNAIGRVAFYRLVRSAIKMLTDGFKEGTQNLYQYSSLMKTDFAPAMDSLATSALYLKNSIGAMAAPLIEAVAPAVDMLVDKFVDLFNMIGKTLAALTGKDVYSQAKKHAVEYGDEANKAAKATKKFLLGIDELNIMDQPSGGSGFTAEDYKSMFEEVAVNPAENMDWAQEIRKSIEEGDWAGAARTLAEKLNSVIAGVNATEIGQSLGGKIQTGLSVANEFIRSFSFSGLGAKAAEFVNGLTNTINPKTVGNILSSHIRMAVDFAYGVVTTFNFSKFGTWLGGVVNGWFDGIEWDKAALVLSQGLKGAFDTLVSFVTEIDWGKIGESVNTFLVTGFNDIAGWLSEVDFYGLAQSLYTNLKTFLDGIDFASIASSLFHLLGVAIGSGAELLLGVIDGVVTDIKNYFLQFIEDENGDGYFGGKEIIAGLIKGMWEGIKGIGEWIVTNIFDPIVNGIKESFGIHSPSTVMAEIGAYIIDGLLKGIKDGWKNITSFFSERISDITKPIRDAWNSLTNLGKSSKEITSQANNAVKNADIQVNKKKYGGNFASGGFPPQGQMFIAREAGPELVGNIGSKSAVANNDQIVSGIASGVSAANDDVINAVMAMGNMIVKAIDEKETDITLDGQKVSRGLYPYNQQTDTAMGDSMVKL